MSTFWDEGIVTSVYRLEVIAAQTGNADFIARAKDLETRLKNEWFPVVQAVFIKGDALKLGEELAAATGTGRTNPSDPINSHVNNVLYDEDTTAGGRVGTPAQEAFVGGDVAANVQALSDDFSSSWSEFSHNTKSAANWTLIALALLLALYLALRFGRG